MPLDVALGSSAFLPSPSALPLGMWINMSEKSTIDGTCRGSISIPSAALTRSRRAATKEGQHPQDIEQRVELLWELVALCFEGVTGKCAGAI